MVTPGRLPAPPPPQPANQPISQLVLIRKWKFFLKPRLVSGLSHRKYNYQFIWKYRVVSDLSPTLGKIGHQWFFKKKWYPWWQNQWFRLCYQRSHNSYKLFWRKNPQKILLTIFNFDLNVIKCPILPLFTVLTWRIFDLRFDLAETFIFKK